MKRFHIILFAINLCLGLFAQSPWNAPGDMLSVIQAPLLNIPAIHIPGETLHITCLAPANTTNWQAELIHNHKTIPLQITNTQWLYEPNRWELSASIPNVPIFELYDLRVTASGGIDDSTQNAVKIIPSRKENYYFVHITDAHMPNRLFYPNAGYETDSLEVNDFRAVLEDINIINPEFVLFTGDVINEGELEAFAGQYWYGWAQRVISQSKVPIYLTVGNHDVGGWNATPPPQGSARRNWWKYFGWSWLDNTDANWGKYTQDYSFTYLNTHYIGLEAYDNYDNWRAQIYGGQSFILSQMQWLNSELMMHPDKKKLLFFHYDFSDQLNAEALGVDMLLWGHTHRNSGSITSFPYNLSTRSVCDQNRAYRVIRVNNEQFEPYNTIYAGSAGNTLYSAFLPSNEAIADSVLAMVVNNQPISFENSLLRFNMPASDNARYEVYNGVLQQVDRGPDANVCYVQVNLLAGSSQYVSVVAHYDTSNSDEQLPSPSLLKVYPNPFKSVLNIQTNTELKSVGIYDIKGRKVDEITIPIGSKTSSWNGSHLKRGVYFVGEKKVLKM